LELSHGDAVRRFLGARFALHSGISTGVGEASMAKKHRLAEAVLSFSCTSPFRCDVDSRSDGGTFSTKRA
jgi:hypothetical protein